MFWLPSEAVRERDHLFPFRQWVAEGHLIETSGQVVDYSQVKADIRAALAEHDITVTALFYDKYRANELTQALHEGEQLGPVSVPGVIGERIEFPQVITEMSPRAMEFERRVHAGLVRHPDNAVLNWQVGHAEAVRDRNQNIRPVKPNPHSGKSIDGIVALVMAFAGVGASAGETVGQDTNIHFI
jgi:phage terminase large subunit-like protein